MCRVGASSSASTVPSRSHVARGNGWPTNARIAAPSAASRNSPVGPTNLSAFHSMGLWLAEIMSPPRRVVVLDGQLTRRRRREPEIDHAGAYRLQRRHDGAVEHWPRNSTVSPDDDRLARIRRGGPRAERGGVARDDFRGQSGAHTAADPRHADHQPVWTPFALRSGPAKLVVTCGRANVADVRDVRHNDITRRHAIALSGKRCNRHPSTAACARVTVLTRHRLLRTARNWLPVTREISRYTGGMS